MTQPQMPAPKWDLYYGDVLIGEGLTDDLRRDYETKIVDSISTGQSVWLTFAKIEGGTSLLIGPGSHVRFDTSDPIDLSTNGTTETRIH